MGQRLHVCRPWVSVCWISFYSNFSQIMDGYLNEEHNKSTNLSDDEPARYTSTAGCTYTYATYYAIRALRAQGKFEYDENLEVAAWCDMSRVSHQQLGDAMTSDTHSTYVRNLNNLFFLLKFLQLMSLLLTLEPHFSHTTLPTSHTLS